MTVKEVYEKIRIPNGHHFKYNGRECVVHNGLNDVPQILLYDDMYCDWICSRYETMRVDYMLRNVELITPIEPYKWHCDAFLETKDIWKFYIDASFKHRKELEGLINE